MKTKTIGGMNGNGNGAGPGTGTRAQLHRLYAFHSQRAEALRIALELLDDQQLQRRGLRSDSVIVEAVRMDEQRRQRKAPKSKRPDYWLKDTIKRRRQATAKKLMEISDDAKSPTTKIGQGMQPLLANGYLKKVKGGWIRTEKEFQP